MTQSLWLFGTRLCIIADHTLTGGQYDLIEDHFSPGTQTPSISTHAIPNNFMCWKGSLQSGRVRTRLC
jgi:hypothetical protein